MLKPRRGRRAVRSRKALAASLTAIPDKSCWRRPFRARWRFRRRPDWRLISIHSICKPPENESVQTWRDLLSEPENSPWHGLLLKKSRLEAERAVREFAALALVDDVIWLKADIPPPERSPPVMRRFD